jgi:hypothetical protein
VLRQDRHDVYALRFENLTPALAEQLRSFVATTAVSASASR